MNNIFFSFSDIILLVIVVILFMLYAKLQRINANNIKQIKN